MFSEVLCSAVYDSVVVICFASVSKVVHDAAGGEGGEVKFFVSAKVQRPLPVLDLYGTKFSRRSTSKIQD